MTGYATLYEGLNREGPGDLAGLNWALDHVLPPEDGHVLDAGCGSGADVAGLLARLPRGRVTAIDYEPAFIARTRARHPSEPRLDALVADMVDPPPGPYDLIWSAGAVYFLGLETALSSWRRLLKKGGRVAFSQIAWRTPDPSPAALAFWDLAYPDMADRAAVEAAVSRAGYRVMASDWLSEQAWVDYYQALAQRIHTLRTSAQPTLSAILDETEAEIAVWQAYGGDYGYLQIVAVPR